MPGLVPLMSTFAATPFRGFGLPAVTNGSAFGATHRLSSIVESRYARNYIPKFRAEFWGGEGTGVKPRGNHNVEWGL